MRKGLVIGAAAAAVIVVAGYAVWRIAFRDTTTPVSAEEVVADAGARTTTTTLPPPSTVAPTTSTSAATTGGSVATTSTEAPPATTASTGSSFQVGSEPGDPGLYAYETVGAEQIDALGGAEHEYPADTFATIQPGGCGTVVRWTALEERWSEQDLCPEADGLRLAGFMSYHEWFGRSDLQEFTCDPATALVVPLEASGSWEYTCSTGERSETWTVDVIGLESLTIDGRTVDALHVRVVSQLDGASAGGSETDTWYLPGTGLILRKVSSSNSTNASPIGDVHYTEQYEITLRSLVPRGT